jgi:hypothetical protein
MPSQRNQVAISECRELKVSIDLIGDFLVRSIVKKMNQSAGLAISISTIHQGHGSFLSRPRFALFGLSVPAPESLRDVLCVFLL